MLSASDGVYEAVNAEARARTFIGLHNDATMRLAAPFAAFCCFQPAVRGGDFLLADGRAVLAELHGSSELARLRERLVSVRVASVPVGALRALPVAALREPLCEALRHLVAVALGVWVADLDLTLAWSTDGQCLQILERPKAPVNRHPRTAHPTFFSSLHSQSAYLQEKRTRGGACGAAAGTSSSTFAGVDVFYGDLRPLEPRLLERIDAAITKHTVRVPMRRGDVVLLDTYQTLHGRDVFDGPREHGVVWLTEADAADAAGAEGGRDSTSAFSALVNLLAVKRKL